MYDDMTPHELYLHTHIFTERMKQEEEEKVTLVWFGEYLHRVKKLPKLNEILGKTETIEKKVMTEEEMYRVVQQLNRQFGGEEVE